MQERLQKIIARAGVASRRNAEKLILEGRVSVNGKIVKKLGAKADPEEDHVRVNEKLLRREEKEYWLVNKPRAVLCAVTDPKMRPLVTSFVPSSKRLYPAGRLDFNSEGLVLLTNDGELAARVTRAGRVAKVYRVKIHGRPEEKELDALRDGIELKGEKLARCRIKVLKQAKNCWFEVVLKQGRNRQIREMFGQYGYSVMRLKRVAIGPVRGGSLAPGSSRRLSEEEVAKLYRAAGLSR